MKYLFGFKKYDLVDSKKGTQSDAPTMDDLNNPIVADPRVGSLNGFFKMAMFENGLYVETKFAHDEFSRSLAELMFTNPKLVDAFKQAFVLLAIRRAMSGSQSAEPSPEKPTDEPETTDEKNANRPHVFDLFSKAIRESFGDESPVADELTSRLRGVMLNENGGCNCDVCKAKRREQSERKKAASQ